MKHYSIDKNGKSTEVIANYKHKCCKKCGTIKNVQKIIKLCFELQDLFYIEPKYRDEYIKKFHATSPRHYK